MVKPEKSNFKSIYNFIKNADEKTLAEIKDIIENPKKYHKDEPWTRVDESLFGKVIKDFGILETEFFFKKNVFLTKKENEYRVIIKTTTGDFCEPNYDSFHFKNMPKLRDIFDEAIKIINSEELETKKID
jgi:hypothetical protein